MDLLGEKLRSIQWTYADKDPQALAELKDRIVAAAKKTKMLKYSELVSGVAFRLPNINNGEPYHITTWNWTGLDRRIIGDFLGYISKETYLEEGFLLSALVIGSLESRPSDLFFEGLKKWGILTDLSEDTVNAFWAKQVQKAFDCYRKK
jgi:hypothetical protein